MSEVVAEPKRPFANPWLLLPLAVFLGLALLFLTRIKSDPGLLPSALIGDSAPSFALPGLAGLMRDGKPVEGVGNADLEIPGGTLLNVFASWCVPCREEQSVLMQLSQDASVNIVGLDQKDDTQNARRFLGTFGNPYRRVGVDASGRTSLDFGVYGVPETFAINAGGLIVAKHVGVLTMADARELLRKAAGR